MTEMEIITDLQPLPDIMPELEPLPDITFEASACHTKPPNQNCWLPSYHVVKIRNFIVSQYQKHSSTIRWIIVAGLLAVYLGYVVWAMVYDAEEAYPLVIISALVGVLVALGYREVIAEKILGKGWNEKIEDVLIPLKRWTSENYWWIMPAFFAAFTIFLIFYLSFVVIEKTSQIRSIGGAVIVLLISLITSKSPHLIRWSFVLLMLVLHVTLALLVIRLPVMYDVLIWIFTLIDKVVKNVFAGAAAAFGDPWFILYPYAFIVASIFIYLAAAFSLVYGLFKIFSPVKSLRKYLFTISDSHLHAFLACTQPLASGLPMYIFSFIGLSKRHVATGMLLTIPAALALANVNFPETPQGRNHSEVAAIKYRRYEQKKVTAGNFYDLIRHGAVIMGKMVFYGYPLAIAFGSIITFLNQAVIWFGTGVGIDITIPKILGYILMPFVYMLGTRWEESELVAYLTSNKVIGVSTRSMTTIASLNTGNLIPRDTLAIVTHTTLGFSYFGTLAMYAPVAYVLCPEEAHRLFAIFPRMMFNASLSCLMTAGVAYTITPDSFYAHEEWAEPSPLYPIIWLLESLPSYKTLMSVASF